jgi:tetratricopeptide (TPR) repeat protein
VRLRRRARLAGGVAVGALLVAPYTRAFARDAGDACADAGTTAWKAVEARGGVVAEIDEDPTQAPPAWWRYPGPRRSAAILATEARAPRGLYELAPAELAAGDILVRTSDAGPCGKLAVIAGRVEERWVLEGANDDAVGDTFGNAFFVDGKELRPEVLAYRVRVKGDSTLGHVRELDRDLAHLERTIAERPPLVAKHGRGAVDEKLHDLVDEAWSLMADPAFDLDRRVLAGRALALAAALDWPGAAESAAAVLDDVLARAPGQADAAVARASVYLLAGAPEKAAPLAATASTAPQAPARALYVLGRALLALGKGSDGLAALRAYVHAADKPQSGAVDQPRDSRASRLLATDGKEPKLAPPEPPLPALRFDATAAHAGVTSVTWGFHVDWPMPWRVVTQEVSPATGLLLDLATERVFDDAGAAHRGSAVILAQRPDSVAARAELLKQGGRTIFPEAKLKTLPPLAPGSRREGFRERHEGEARQGEITTVERAGVVYFLVLNAPASAYPKLKDEYAAFVKSLTAVRAP